MPEAGGSMDFVRADLPDLRDRIYEPSLRRLAVTNVPDWLKCDGADGGPVLRIAVRDQGDEGSCVAQSLAALIDILKLDETERSAIDPDEQASARMLFRLAIDQQLAATGSTDFFTLRPGVKAFYHNGACARRSWPDEDVSGDFTADRSKDARRTSLGAYYRLRPLLNHYHAAINETGAILVAAMTHTGWRAEKVAANGGHIDTRQSMEQGGHAFVVVGYDADGFYVLNSWGPDWGGCRELPGIAHWSYGDWAETILDAWVLRLGVPTPNAFHLSLGEQGFGAAFGGIAARGSSARRFDVVGHYAHLDDGAHVRMGTYPSSRAGVAETVSYLCGGQTTGTPDKGAAPKIATRTRYRDVLLRIAGGTEDTAAAMNHIALTKQFWKDADVYPYSLVWCSDFVSEVSSVLIDLLERTAARVGVSGAAYDRAAEVAVRGIGRAFWRDVKYAARKAGSADGDAYDLFRQFVELHQATDQYRLHLVVEGAGADLLLCLLDTLDPGQTKQLAEAVSTLSLVAPACRLDDYKARGAPFVEAMREAGGDGRAVLYRPDPAFEAQLRVGKYGKSILHLIANAFEERSDAGPAGKGQEAAGQGRRPAANPPLLLGMGRPGADAEDAVQNRKTVPLDALSQSTERLPVRRAPGGLDVVDIAAPGGKPGPYELLKVIYHPEIRTRIRDRIRASSA